MITATRLPARVRKLERQMTVLLKDHVPFESKLATFQVLMSGLHDLDCNHRPFPDRPTELELIMEWFDVTEAEIRQAVHELMPMFEAHVECPSDWSPLTGLGHHADHAKDLHQ